MKEMNQFQGSGAAQSASMRLIVEPLCSGEDLGRPIPNSPFAVSVAMPTWQDVIDYEKGSPRVAEALQSGYPRFVIKGFTAELFNHLQRQQCEPGQQLVAFPSRESAVRCLEFVREEFPGVGRISATEYQAITACIVPAQSYSRARAYWQHSGEIVSGRWAEACLLGKAGIDGPSPAKSVLKERIARLAGSETSEVDLFPSGMAAIAAIQRVVQRAHPEGITAQIGFPYVDTLKVQEKFGNQCLFFPAVGSSMQLELEMSELERRAALGNIAAIYTEFPANPLLTVPPLERLWEISVRYQVPLIVDETLASFANVRVLPYATAVVTSLTKYFSGEGDVCGGSLVWNPHHPAYERLSDLWQNSREDQVFDGDAVALERNSCDFPERMVQINKNASVLVDYLGEHPQIDSVFYPNREPQQKARYDSYRLEKGGYGGLFSMRVKGGEAAAARFYDALEVSKGPSLGTNFTLACPYTLLAHFLELPKVAQFGVTADLIRVSVGLEQSTDLIGRFERALLRV